MTLAIKAIVVSATTALIDAEPLKQRRRLIPTASPRLLHVLTERPVVKGMFSRRPLIKAEVNPVVVYDETFTYSCSPFEGHNRKL